jgi:hypothetical protein
MLTKIMVQLFDKYSQAVEYYRIHSLQYDINNSPHHVPLSQYRKQVAQIIVGLRPCIPIEIQQK